MACLQGFNSLAATYTVPSLSGSSIQSTINNAYAAGSNNTVLLPAGLYNISNSINVPCDNGLTITGPATSPSTAVLNATFSGNDIFTMSACNGITIAYLQFTNTGGIYANNSNHSGITITHNQFYGLPSSIGGASNASAAVYLDGNINTTISNFSATWNTFGDSNSCSAVFTTTTDEGGYCAGIYAQPGTLVNPVVQYNTFNHVEEGIHYHQICSGCARGSNQSVTQNSNVQFNYFVNWHRIAIEMQGGIVGSAQIISDNALASPINPSYGTMFISDACCTGGRSYLTSGAPNPANLTEDNLEWTATPQQVGSFWAPVIGIEYWGGAGSRANHNFLMGNFSNQVNWGFGVSPWYVQNNYLCGAHNGGYITNEENSVTPVISGNTTVATCTQQTSTASTISPASGAYTSPPTITLANSGRNTSTWYTTDGSTPVPGSGTATLYTGPFGITLPITIKAVGMWGVPPQPTSYPAPYGFMPSAVATANYTSSGGLVLSSVALSNVGSVHSLVTSTSIQMTATCTYSDGSTTNCNSNDAHGNSVSSWNTDASAVAISASGLASAVSPGSATITAVVAGMTTPGWVITVTAPVVSLSSVALATTGGVTTLAAGGVNQLLATCQYSDGSTTNCATTDLNGNTVSPWSSSAATVATVSSTGVVTGVGGGSTNLTATVTPSTTTSQWGAPTENMLGNTFPGFINATYVVLGTQAGGYAGGTCSFYLPAGTLTVGSKYDCGLVPAPTPTTQGTAWQCWYTYTVTSTTSPGGWVTGALNNCGKLAAGSAWWVALVTNQSGQSPAGFYNCGNSCSGSAPTTGNGSYGYWYIADPYGTRTGMATAMHAGGSSQAAQYVTLTQPAVVSAPVPLTVNAVTPTLVSAYLSAPGSVHTLTVGSTLPFSAHCQYSDGSTTDCTVADIRGNAVTEWTTSAGGVVTIGAVGSAMPGLAMAFGAGSANIQAFVGSVASSLWPLTVTNPVVTLTGLSLATTHGVTGLFVGNTNLLVAMCVYSDGTSTQCNTADSHGNAAGSYVSSSPAVATVGSASGLVTGVAPGTTKLRASAGSVTSTQIPLAVLAVPSGMYTITISGPVKFSGRVEF